MTRRGLDIGFTLFLGLGRLGSLALGRLAHYSPVSPPPGSRIFVIQPQRASIASAHSTPLARLGATLPDGLK